MRSSARTTASFGAPGRRSAASIGSCCDPGGRRGRLVVETMISGRGPATGLSMDARGGWLISFAGDLVSGCIAPPELRRGAARGAAAGDRRGPPLLRLRGAAGRRRPAPAARRSTARRRRHRPAARQGARRRATWSPRRGVPRGRRPSMARCFFSTTGPTWSAPATPTASTSARTTCRWPRRGESPAGGGGRRPLHPLAGAVRRRGGRRGRSTARPDQRRARLGDADEGGTARRRAGADSPRGRGRRPTRPGSRSAASTPTTSARSPTPAPSASSSSARSATQPIPRRLRGPTGGAGA